MSGSAVSGEDYRPQRPGAGRRAASVHHYTRYVAIMRRLLPAVAVVLVAIIVSWPQLLPDNRVQVGYSDEDLADMGRHSLSMVNPRYYGVDGQMRPYSIFAEAAKQSPGQIINLDQPRADMKLKDGGNVLLDARHGTYQQEEQRLQLRGDVNLSQDSGYEIHTQSATIDLMAGTAEGHEPVDGHGPSVQLEGEGFRLIERGQTIFLTGKSHVVLNPTPKAP